MAGHAGITAFELMVTMAIIAILMATAVPAIKNYSWNLRLRSAIDMLQTDLNLARGRAISHNVQTVVCPSANGLDCSGSSMWQNGWIVFTDINGDRHKQQSERLLKQAGQVEFLDISSSRGRTYLRFYPNGSAPGTNISILFCDQRGAKYARRLIVSNSGRIRVATDAVQSTEECP